MFKDEYFTMSNGVKAPKIAFGTWQIPDGEICYNATLQAIKAGYRHIDTAYAYQNEKSVGKAIKDSGLKREEIFITTKLPAERKGYQITLDTFKESLENLDVDYIDLYLIHAPWPWTNIGHDCTKENIESWRAMIELYQQGLIKSIGVSNFRPENIDPLVEATGFIPHANQIRYFIGNTQPEVCDYCIKKNILIEAYSPLATGNILNDKVLVDMANKYNVTTAQICLAYCLKKNTLILPKSTHEERIKANLDVDVDLSKEDMAILDSVHNAELDRPLRS